MTLHGGTGGAAALCEPLLVVVGTARTTTAGVVSLSGDVATTYLGDIGLTVAITPSPITKPFPLPSTSTPPRRYRRHIAWDTHR